MTVDTAYVTPMIMLRPDAHDPGKSLPRPALVVRYPSDDAGMRELVIRSLLRRRWDLVASPAGRYEFQPAGPRGRVYLSDGTVRIVVGETLYDGPLPLRDGIAGEAWQALAQAIREIAVYVAVGTAPILSIEDVDTAARAGQLVGIVAQLR